MDDPVSSFGVAFLNSVFNDKHFEPFGLDKKTKTISHPSSLLCVPDYFFGPFYEPEDLKSMSLTA